MLKNPTSLLSTIVSTWFLLILAACASNQTAEVTATPLISEPGDSPPATAPVDRMATPTRGSSLNDLYAAENPAGQALTFWHPYTGLDETALGQIAADFNATNPWGITLKPEFRGNYAQIFDQMLVFMNTAEAPDLLMALPEQAAAYQLSDALVDLDDLIYSPAWGLTSTEIADFFPGYFEKDRAPTFNSQHLGIPLSGQAQVLYYNQSWLQELGYAAPPATPDAFRQMACAAAAQPFSGATAEGSTGYALKVDSANLTNWIFAFDGPIFDDPAAQYSYANPAAQDSARFIQSLIQQGCLTLVTEEHADRFAFSRGTALFIVDPSTALLDYQSQIEANARFQWGAAPLPSTATAAKMNLSGPSVSLTRSNPARELAAWLFIEYFLDPAVQARWAQATGDFPVRASASAGLAEYLAAHPPYAAIFEALGSGDAKPAVPGYDQVRPMAAEAFFAIALGADAANILSALTAEANTNLQAQRSTAPQPSDPWVDVDPSGQTIAFWHQQAPARHALLEEIIARFNNTNPWGITVVPEYQGSASELFQKTSAALQSGIPPGLVEAYQDQAAAYALDGGLSDLTSLINSIRWGLTPQEQADFFAGIYAQDIFPNLDNARLGFPFYRSLNVLYYNADWLADLQAAGAIDFSGPPLTPEQFQAAACAAAQNPFRGALTEGSWGYEFSPDATAFASWAFAAGANLYDLQRAQYSFDHPAAVASQGFLQELVALGCARSTRQPYQDQESFAQGTTLFTTGSSAGLPFYQRGVSEGADFSWQIAALPHIPSGPVLNLYGPSFSIPAGTPEAQLAAWLFIQYFTSPETQAEWAQATGYLPVRASAESYLSAHFSANPHFNAAWQLLPFGLAEPSTPGYDDVRKMVGEAFGVILAGERPQPTLRQLNQDANLNLTEQLTR